MVDRAPTAEIDSDGEMLDVKVRWRWAGHDGEGLGGVEGGCSKGVLGVWFVSVSDADTNADADAERDGDGSRLGAAQDKSDSVSVAKASLNRRPVFLLSYTFVV